MLDGVQRGELTADGTTTGPSPYLLDSTNGTYVDKDKPAPLDLSNAMGELRGYVTRLQDDINTYLTERIQASSQEAGADVNNAEEDQDDDDDEDDDDEDENI